MTLGKEIKIPLFIKLPCGNRAFFDTDSEMGYRCEACNAITGSIGQPRECYELEKKYENWEKLGGKGWDYGS